MTQINQEMRSHQKASKILLDILSGEEIPGFAFISVIDSASLCNTGGLAAGVCG